MKKKRYLFMALISMAMSSPSSVMAAYLINIRFGGPVAVSYSGIGAYTGSSSLGVNDTWNLIGAVQGDNVTGSQSNLALTTTTLSNAGFSYISDTVTNGGLKKTGFYPASQDALMASYVYAENGSMTITGLGAGTQFDLYVLSQPLKTGTNQGSNEMLTFNVNGSSPYSIGPSVGTQSSFSSGLNYLMEPVTANSQGKLVITYSGAVNGLQLVSKSQSIDPPGPTPEPASMVLLGVGGALLSARKLRKKKSAESSVS